MAALHFDETLVRIIDDATLGVHAIEDELAGVLVAGGFAKADYPAALREREDAYPTALEVPGGISVAVPHCDPENVAKGALCVGVLKHPVSWRRMDAPDVSCEVSLVVMLALDEAHAHLEMLQKVVALIQDQELVARVIACDVPADAYALVRDHLS